MNGHQFKNLESAKAEYSGKSSIVYRMEVNEHGSIEHRYGGCDTFDEFIIRFSGLKESDRTLHEVCDGRQKIKLDIDFTYSENDKIHLGKWFDSAVEVKRLHEDALTKYCIETDFKRKHGEYKGVQYYRDMNQYINNHYMSKSTNWTAFIYDIQLVFGMLYADTISYDDIIICDSSDDTKFSRHVIIDKYMVDNNNEAKHFAQTLINECRFIQQLFKDQSKTPIDMQVYSKNQCFRIAGCHKYGSKRVKKIISDHVQMQTFITYTKDCELLPKLLTNEESTATATAITANAITATIEEPIELQKILETPTAQVHSELCLATHSPVKPNRKQSDPKTALDGLKISSKQGNIIKYRREKPSMCVSCERVHDHDNAYVTKSYSKGVTTYLYHCYHNPKNPVIIKQVKDKPTINNGLGSLMKVVS